MSLSKAFARNILLNNCSLTMKSLAKMGTDIDIIARSSLLGPESVFHLKYEADNVFYQRSSTLLDRLRCFEKTEMLESFRPTGCSLRSFNKRIYFEACLDDSAFLRDCRLRSVLLENAMSDRSLKHDHSASLEI